MTRHGGRRLATLAAASFATALALTGCGNDESPEAAPSTTPSTTQSSAPSGSPSDDNRCLTDAGVDQPSGVGHDTKQFIGLPPKEAKQKAADDGLETRLAGRDGTCFAMTMDYRSDRVNFYVEDGVVVVATIG
jgi:hypothetical protein